jgi:hypothetical protein
MKTICSIDDCENECKRDCICEECLDKYEHLILTHLE